MKIRQTERPMGARLRLARAKCLPHPRPLSQGGSGECKAFRQVVPRRDILFIPKGSSLCFERVQTALSTEDRFEQAKQASNERIRNSMYNLRREGVGNVKN